MGQSKFKILKFALLILVLSSLGCFIWMTDLSQVIHQLSQCAGGFILVLFISLFAYWFGALAWRHSFLEANKISIWKLFYIRTIGEVITMINPTNIIAGEASKIILLKGIDKRQITDSIMISRFAMILTQLTLSLICVIYLAIRYHKISVLIISMISILAISYIVYRFGIQRFIANNFPKQYQSISQFCVKSVSHFKAAPIQSFKVLGYSVIHWCMGALEFMLILYLLGYGLYFIDAISIDMGVVIIKSLAGFIPGQIGVEELGNKMMLDLVGFGGAGIWVSVSIIRRAKQLFWIGLSCVFYIIHKFYQNTKYNKDEHLIYNA